MVVVSQMTYNLQYIKKLEDILFVHGDKLVNETEKVIIMGHEHPAISFEERRDEKFKCFLLGKYKKSKLIIIPSFNFLTEGSDVTKENGHTPYVKSFKNFITSLSLVFLQNCQ